MPESRAKLSSGTLLYRYVEGAIEVHGNNFEDAKKNMEAALEGKIKSFLDGQSAAASKDRVA